MLDETSVGVAETGYCYDTTDRLLATTGATALSDVRYDSNGNTTHRSPAGRLAGNHVRPGLLHLLDLLTATPAEILADLLAQNTIAETLFGTICSPHTHDCAQDHNVLWRWFNDPAGPFPADEQVAQAHRLVADLRAAVARRGDDADATALVDRLSATSTEFHRMHEVAVPHHTRLRIRHLAIGPIVLDCEVLLTPGEGQRLLVYTARPGSERTDSCPPSASDETRSKHGDGVDRDACQAVDAGWGDGEQEAVAAKLCAQCGEFVELGCVDQWHRHPSQRDPVQRGRCVRLQWWVRVAPVTREDGDPSAVHPAHGVEADAR